MSNKGLAAANKQLPREHISANCDVTREGNLHFSDQTSLLTKIHLNAAIKPATYSSSCAKIKETHFCWKMRG